MTERTLKGLGAPTFVARCTACGERLADPIRLSVTAQQNTGRKNVNWLYRRSVTVCEPCAVGAVEAALANLGATG